MNKKLILGLFGVIILLVIAVLIKQRVNDSIISQMHREVLAKSVPKTPLNQDSLFLNDLSGKIRYMRDKYSPGDFTPSVEGIITELNEFTSWDNWIFRAEKIGTDSAKIFAAKLRKNAGRIKSSEFPALRKAYGKIVADKMWEHDVYSTTTGDKSSVLNLTGGLFASNKNIKEIQESLSDMFQKLRFKEIRYRWYKESDQFTYYKLSPIPDNE